MRYRTERDGLGNEALLKALEDHQAGKQSQAEIEKIREPQKKYGFIDKAGKFIWKPSN